MKKKKKKIKRVGRGGKRGTYSGKGQKGQKARAGHKIYPAEHDLFMRIPKLRGVKNKRLKKPAIVIKLKDLNSFAKDGILTKDILKKNKVIRKYSDSVKILDVGDVKEKFSVYGIDISKNAKKKIESKGGSVK